MMGSPVFFHITEEDLSFMNAKGCVTIQGQFHVLVHKKGSEINEIG